MARFLAQWGGSFAAWKNIFFMPYPSFDFFVLFLQPQKFTEWWTTKW